MVTCNESPGVVRICSAFPPVSRALLWSGDGSARGLAGQGRGDGRAYLHSRGSHCAPRAQAASDAHATVWVKSMNEPDEQYAPLSGVDLQQTVNSLKASWAREVQLNVHASLITLRLVSCLGDEPTTAEELTAKELRPHHTLARATVADGSWLLASVAGSPGAQSSFRCVFGCA